MTVGTVGTPTVWEEDGVRAGDVITSVMQLPARLTHLTREIHNQFLVFFQYSNDFNVE